MLPTFNYGAQLRDWSLVGLFFLGAIALITRTDTDHSKELDLCLAVVQECEVQSHQVNEQINAIFTATKKEICK